MNNDTALLVIDVQSGMFEDDPPFGAEELLVKVAGLLSKARAAQVPVVYIQHNDGSEKEPLHPSQAGWQIHPAVAPQAGETVVQKHYPDAFQETTLQGELDSRGIKKLVVAGLQTEFCVDTTCRRAFSQGYEVTLVTDAHSTWSNKVVTADQIIGHHNRTLTGWFATGQTAEQVEFEPVSS